MRTVARLHGHGMRRSLCGAAGLLATLALAGCAGSAASSVSASGAPHALVGAPAPAFQLREVSGNAQQSLAAYSGKVVIIDFWATWCQPCKQSFPAYERLVRSSNGKLVVLAVSQDDEAAGIPAFVAETGATFPVVWDEDKSVAKSYDPPTMPTAFIVDKSGIVRFAHAGYRAGDEATIERQVRSLEDP